MFTRKNNNINNHKKKKIHGRLSQCAIDDLEEINIALCLLESGGRDPIGSERNLEVTFNLGLEIAKDEIIKPQPVLKVKLHIDIENSGSLLLVKVLNLIGIESQQMLPLKYNAKILVALFLQEA